ncbi:MAG TPA: hypothetical protein DCL21_07040 [Alphaproteobacteria bacterium]|nr:hypothetical protein [Alphaproteobacteria bacterium]
MDFIARAGSLIDQGHRVVGILLVVIVVQFMWIQSVRTEKAELQNTINYQNRTQSIYVVPNSQADIYKPADSKLLLSTFVDFISQSLLTYTHANLENQYQSIRDFLSPKMLEMADNFFLAEIKKSKVERISSLFVADRTSTELSEFKELADKTNRYGEKTYAVTIKGKRNIIVGGRVIETKDMHVKLQLQETRVSQENPFGFQVTKIDLVNVKR